MPVRSAAPSPAGVCFVAVGLVLLQRNGRNVGFGGFGDRPRGAWGVNEPRGRLRDVAMVPNSRLHTAKVTPDRFGIFHFCIKNEYFSPSDWGEVPAAQYEVSA